MVNGEKELLEKLGSSAYRLTALDVTKWRSPTIQIADEVGGACGRQGRTDARMHNQRPGWLQDPRWRGKNAPHNSITGHGGRRASSAASDAKILLVTAMDDRGGNRDAT